MKKLIPLLLISLTLSSCYVHKNIVGDGAQKGIVETAKQHNFVYGLVSGKTPDTQEMAKGENNYEVTTVHSFIDGLIGALTGGLYNPTTVEVKR
ncbi:MAG: hypothetical protein CMC63_01500 [Flavobacteriaceae bacterium]|nr:hypothetical protein [Flavobacteriaceae bacterium]